MKSKDLSLAFSPCPNDTFAFHAMVHGLVDTHGYRFDVTLTDVEELNTAAAMGAYDICKMSYSAYFGLCDKYVMLRSGSALGFNNGPLLVHAKDYTPTQDDLKNFRIAIPGEHTTAALLLRSAFPELTDLTPVLFSDIEESVLNGTFDAGLLIHEGRFTYRSRGLKLIHDMGEYWQSNTGLPIPLGGIAIKRELIEDAAILNDILRSSIEYAFANPSASAAYVKENAQEMDPEVQRSHISLYVNDYSKDIGELGMRAVEALYNKASEIYSTTKKVSNLFIY